MAVLLPQGLALGCGLYLDCRFGSASVSDPWAWMAWLAAWTLVAPLVDPALRRAVPRNWFWLVAVIGAWLLGWWLSPTAQPWQFAVLVYAAGLGRLARQGWLHTARLNHSVVAEALRWVLLGLGTLALLHPYTTSSLVGGGDAQMYAQLLADCIAQLREGICPVLAGQSGFAFNGDIHPLRTAPGFFYAGGMLDVLTLRSLTAVAVQNLLIVLSGLTAALASYQCLVRLVPRCGWTAWLLAMLFISSPGVLSPLFSGDMVATWMTLPWLPLLFYAVIRMVDQPAGIRWPVQAAATLAALWLFHAPIGFWVSVCILPFGAWRVWTSWKHPHRLLESFGALGLFVVLAGFVFVSVSTLALPADPNLRAAIASGAIQAGLEQSWRGFCRPISPLATAFLSDLQLSPGLWLALLLGALTVRRVQRISNMLLGLGVLFLLLMLLPALDPVWRVMPDVVLNATDKWPAQRFYIILSAAVPFLALPALASFRAKYARFFSDCLIVLTLACARSLVESVKFIHRGWLVTSSAEMTRRRFLPENIQPSRYAFEYYGRLPRYFSNGPAEPLSQTRLLARDTLEPSMTNASYLLGNGSDPGEINFQYEATDYGGRFTPRLQLAPNERCVLSVDFRGARPQGVLQLAGHDLLAEYALPDSGEERAFGAGQGRESTLTFWHRGASVDSVEIKFIRTPGQPTALTPPKLRALPYGHADLPLQLHHLIPFQLTVRTEAPAWLETPKLFVPGYVARVNGRPVEVALSPDGLVMVPVPAGTSAVELSYPGPFSLRAIFWVSAGAWMTLAMFAFIPQVRRAQLGRAGPEHVMAGIGRMTAAGTLVLTALLGGMLVWSNTVPVSNLHQSEGRMTFVRQFPIGQARGTVVPVASLKQGPYRGTLWLDCVDGKQASVGFMRNGQTAQFGEPFPVNYLAAHRLEIIESPTDRSTLQVRVDERLVLNLPMENPGRYGALPVSDSPTTEPDRMPRSDPHAG